jgi:hypothetical protein
MTMLAACTSSGLQRDAGSGTTSPSATWNAYRESAPKCRATASCQPPWSAVIGSNARDAAQVSSTATLAAAGAQRRKRVVPSASSAAPNGMRC